MLILYRYLAGEFLAKTLIAAGILNFVMLLVNLQRRAMDYIVNEDYPISLIVHFVGLMLPVMLSYSIPWSVLVATLIIFGRLSADHELVAMRSCGISMGHIIAPFMILSLAFTSLSIFINAEVAPRCQMEAKRLFSNFALKNPTALFETDRFNAQLGDISIYVAKKDGMNLEGIIIYQADPLGYPLRSIRAERGQLRKSDADEWVLLLTLDGVRMEERNAADPSNLQRIQYGRSFDQYEMTISLGEIRRDNIENRSIAEHSFGELFNELFLKEDPKFTPNYILVELHKRISLPFACFTFVLIGIPLGIRVQRSEKSIGILVSFLVAMVYYLFVVLAEALRKKTGIYPELFLWLPNLVFNAFGLWLLWKQNKV